MKYVINVSNTSKDLYSRDGDSVTIQPGTTLVDDKFTVNLPPQVLLKGDK
jgi:hypothetical protein